MVDGSALKKLMTGFSTVAAGAGGGGGGVCATFFLPHAANATNVTAANAKLTRRFVIPLNFLLGSHPF
jgi:hypothetical protein